MKVRKAIIPAAGWGTRFLPATKSLPKEMLTVIDKPLLQYTVEEAVSSGIKRVGVIISSGKSVFKDHFAASPDLEEFLRKKRKFDLLKEVRRLAGLAELRYIRQKEALGLGHAILMGKSFIGGEPFATLNPDDIFDCPVPCTRQLLDVFARVRATVVVLGRVDMEGTRKYGIVKPKEAGDGGRLFQILDMAEKPGPEKAFSDLAMIGRYVFTPEIFDAIQRTKPDKRGEIEITDAIKLLLEKQPVYGYLFEGTRYDCGEKMGLIKAAVALALKRLEFSSDLRTFLRTLL
jgi:UTP--glucose-1-phosphate uridylyltransferase